MAMPSKENGAPDCFLFGRVVEIGGSHYRSVQEEIMCDVHKLLKDKTGLVKTPGSLDAQGVCTHPRTLFHRSPLDIHEKDGGQERTAERLPPGQRPTRAAKE